MSSFEQHDKPQKASSFWKSLGFAWEGLVAASRERNFRIDCCFAVFALAMNIICRVSVIEWCIVLILIGLVLSLETFNTALEATVDLATDEIKPLAKKAKDCAAGAVLVVAIISAVVGLIIYIPALLALI